MNKEILSLRRPRGLGGKLTAASLIALAYQEMRRLGTMTIGYPKERPFHSDKVAVPPLPGKPFILPKSRWP